MARLSDSAHLVEAFLDMMSAERGAGANTLAAYRRDLLDFAGHADPAKASREQVRGFLTGLSASGMAASTQARKLSALRQFYGFLYGEGIRSDDPTQTIAAPRARRPLPKILSGNDLEAMLAIAGEDQTPAGLRLTLIVEMLYGGGLRVSELAGLTLAAVRTKESSPARATRNAFRRSVRQRARRWTPIWRCALRSCRRTTRTTAICLRRAARMVS
jgi:integrase/recombinase XerD